MAELLLELFSEEIPARMQLPMAEQLKRVLEERMKAEELYFSHVKTYVTPRRVTAFIDDLSLTQEDRLMEKRGPKVEADENAIAGFAKSAGVSVEQLKRKQTPKGEFYFFISQQKGRPTTKILEEILPQVIAALSWPKSMRWGDNKISWVRPLKNICCIFGGEALSIKYGHLRANDSSCGHRFLAPEAFTVIDFKQYKAELKKRFVVLETEERKNIISTEANRLAKEKGLTVKADEKLLEEVAGLVEWPVLLLGRIEKKFMKVPDEVLVSSIRTHQKYFCLENNDGELAPYFIVASNMETEDKGAAIIAGNERVLRARLSDASFFWDQDRKKSLEERLPELEKVVFHARLGTVAEKVKRVVHLTQFLSVWVPHANLRLTERAASLCKADLVTEMVGEFPDLQGVMGYYYALEAEENDEIAHALKEHYSPLGPDDMVPDKPVSIAVALADKVDTLAGLFAIREKPTGSKDPFALRRAALGVIRIILENNLSVPLKVLFSDALAHYPKSMFVIEQEKEGKKILQKLAKPLATKVKPATVVEEMLEFFIDRLKVLLKSRGIRHDLISAVFGEGNEDDLTRLTLRVTALETFLSTDDGNNLLAGYKRAGNIVAIEEKNDKTRFKGSAIKMLLEQDEEKQLHGALAEINPNIKKALKNEEFKEAMALLAGLRKPIDAFLDNVTVNCGNSDVRKNRLMLLAQMRLLVDEIADFSKIEG